MSEVNPQEKLRTLLLLIESGEFKEGQDLELLTLLSDHPDLRTEYFKFIQYTSMQHQIWNKFDRKSHLSEVEALMKKQMSSKGLDEDEEIQLQKCLSKSKQARAYYIESCQVDAMLKESLGGLVNKPLLQNEKPQTVIKPVEVKKSTSIYWKVALLAASILVVFETLVILSMYSKNSESIDNSKINQVAMVKPSFKVTSTEPMAYVLDSRGAKVHKSNVNVAGLGSGDALSMGEFELLGGLLKLEFHGGAEVVIEAPAKFDILNSKKVKLHSGKVSANVPEAAIGFTIDTPTSEVIDLGTAFAVEVDAFGRDEVHVFDGEVVVKNKKTNRQPSLHLFENQALRMDLETHTPSNIDIDQKRFLRQVKEKSHVYSDSLLGMNPMFHLNMSPGHDGLTLLDLTGHGFDAKAINYKKQQPHWAPGAFGMSAKFGGPGTKWGYVIPDFKKIESGSFTVMAWIYAKSRPQWASIAKNWFMEKGQFHFGLKETTGLLEGHIYDEANEEEIFVMDDKVLPLNRWHHVALSAGEGFMRLYRNGVMVDEQEIPGLYHDPKFDWVSIGAKLDIERKPEKAGSEEEIKIRNLKHIRGSYWDGMIDELSFFDRVIEESDVQQLYRIGKKGI